MGNSVYYLTKGDLKRACEENRFILLTHVNGFTVGLNCNIALLGAQRKPYSEKEQINFIGYQRCDFMEYLTYKARIVAF
jgi:hypothetical protein